MQGGEPEQPILNAEGNVQFTYTPSTPTNENVKVGISTKTGYNIKYSIGDAEGEYQDYTGEITVEENTAIYVKLANNRGNTGEVATGNVQNIDKVAPNEFTMELTSTTNSITVSGSTTDVGSPGCAVSNIGISGYQFKLDNGNWTATQTSGTYTFSGLTQGTTYTVQMKAIDLAGNEREATTEEGEIVGEITTEEVINSAGVIGISYSPTTPTRNNVTVTITDNSGVEGLTLKYRTGSTTGTWTTYTRPITMSSNRAIYARLEDSTGQANGYATANIANIDKVAPKAFTPTIEEITANSIVLNASTTDTGSSGCATTNIGIKEYRYYVGEELKYTGLQESITITGLTNVESHNIYVIAEDLAGNTTTSKTVTPYGVEISGYTTQNGAPITWRVFHIDGENIYLVAGDYITLDYMPNTAYGIKPKAVEKSFNNYHVQVFDISEGSPKSGYKGTDDILIEDVKIRKWINYINYYNSTNSNMKATAYLLDADIWTGFKDINNKAEYAIGGPTLEMYINSYNDTHPERKIEYDMNNFGYKVKFVNDEDFSKNVILSEKDFEFGLYFGKKVSVNSSAWWLASPLGYGEERFLWWTIYLYCDCLGRWLCIVLA